MAKTINVNVEKVRYLDSDYTISQNKGGKIFTTTRPDVAVLIKWKLTGK